MYVQLPRRVTNSLVVQLIADRKRDRGRISTVYPKKYAHGFVVLCFVVVMQSFIMNSYELFIHIYQGCFAGTGAIVKLPLCQWSKSDGYGKISQCITTTKHCKAKTVCIFLGIYCMQTVSTEHNRNVSICSPSEKSVYSVLCFSWHRNCLVCYGKVCRVWCYLSQNRKPLLSEIYKYFMIIMTYCIYT